MNIFKRIKFYFEYKKLIKTHKDELLTKYNVRVDKINRMYTVINIPDETQIYGEENAKKLTETWLKNWLAAFDKFLYDNGIKELTDVSDINQVDNQNFLLIIRYKYLKIESLIIVGFSAAIITFITFLTILFIKII